MARADSSISVETAFGMAHVGYGRQASTGELVAFGVAGVVIVSVDAAFGWSGSVSSACRSIRSRRAVWSSPP